MAISILVIVVFLGAAVYCDHRWRHRPTHLDGWWHYQSNGVRWMPRAWADACETSLERSRRRRFNDDH